MILDFVRASLPRSRGRAERGAEAAHRRPRRRLAVPAVDLGDGNRRARRRHGRPGAISTSCGRSPAVCPYPITLCNDATAACAAEFFFGRGWRYRDFLYFFLGAFLGGGVVLDGALVARAHRQRRRARVDAGHGRERRPGSLRSSSPRLDLPARTPPRARRRRRLVDLGDARQPGRTSGRISTPGSKTWPRRSPMRRSQRSR